MRRGFFYAILKLTMGFACSVVDSQNLNHYLGLYDAFLASTLFACDSSLPGRIPTAGKFSYFAKDPDDKNLVAVVLEDPVDNIFAVTLLEETEPDKIIIRYYAMKNQQGQQVIAHMTLASFLKSLGYIEASGSPTGAFKDYIKQIPNVLVDSEMARLDLREF